MRMVLQEQKKLPVAASSVGVGQAMIQEIRPTSPVTPAPLPFTIFGRGEPI
jgi:hypothetical protein